MWGTGSTLQSTLLLFFTLALLDVSAEPYQCADIRLIISVCSCESRIWKGIENPNQVVINCRNLNLKNVPDITGSSNHVIYEMTLENNDITTIPDAAFRGLKIQRLNLRKNRLTTFSNNSFQTLESVLKELELGAERGADVPIPIDSLVVLSSLTTLMLEHFKVPNNMLDPGLLNRITHLTSLSLRNMGLTHVEPNSLPYNLTSLTLDQHSLSLFPTDAIRQLLQLESLTIINTVIAACFNQMFEKNTKLAYLDLSHNRMNTLSNGCFRGITSSLTTLSLSNNPIPDISALQEVKELTALTTLILTETTLSYLGAAPAFLLNKANLTYLYLDGNTLSTLQPDVFSGLVKLKELYLAFNNLSILSDQAFSGLPSLQYLDLGHQVLAPGVSLALPQSLSSLPSLHTLKLTRSMASPDSLWAKIGSIPSLTHLYLEGLSLASVPDYALANLTKLQMLSLNSNSLAAVTQEMLAGLRNLKNLTMSRNSITTVDRCAFYGFYFAKPLYLDLTTNPLHCDCKLRWLLEKNNTGSISLSQSEQCQTPAEMSQEYLVNIKPEQLTCISPEPEEPCLELYTTTPAPVTTTTPITPCVHNLTVTNATATSIILAWVSNPDFMGQSLSIKVQDLDLGKTVIDDSIAADKTYYEAKRLNSNTHYSLCLLANGYETVCTATTKTLADPSADDQDGDEGTNVGIIVGAVAAVLVLAAIIAAIIYLLVCRRRRSRDMPPQPHVFSPKELPTMAADSRHFSKPRDKQAPKVGRALDVSAISDGKTAPVSPRHSAGSYQFLDKTHPNPNPDMVPKDAGIYHNDVESRALPSAPHTEVPAYHNMDGSANYYNEIKH